MKATSGFMSRGKQFKGCQVSHLEGNSSRVVSLFAESWVALCPRQTNVSATESCSVESAECKLLLQGVDMAECDQV